MKNLNIALTLFVFAMAFGMSESRAAGGTCGQESGASLTRMKAKDVASAPVQQKEKSKSGSSESASSISKSKK